MTTDACSECSVSLQSGITKSESGEGFVYTRIDDHSPVYLQVVRCESSTELTLVSEQQRNKVKSKILESIDRAYNSPLPGTSRSLFQESSALLRREAIIYSYLSQINEYTNPYWGVSLDSEENASVFFVVNCSSGSDLVVVATMRFTSEYPTIALAVVELLRHFLDEPTHLSELPVEDGVSINADESIGCSAITDLLRDSTFVAQD